MDTDRPFRILKLISGLIQTDRMAGCLLKNVLKSEYGICAGLENDRENGIHMQAGCRNEGIAE